MLSVVRVDIDDLLEEGLDGALKIERHVVALDFPQELPHLAAENLSDLLIHFLLAAAPDLADPLDLQQRVVVAGVEFRHNPPVIFDGIELVLGLAKLLVGASQQLLERSIFLIQRLHLHLFALEVVLVR
jgi:hypothetical protein